jgi:hypothetical protein
VKRISLNVAHRGFQIGFTLLILFFFFRDGDSIITDKLEIANKFNAFLTNIGLDLAKQIKMPSNINFKSYLKHTYSTEFAFHEIDHKTVEQNN